MKERRRDREIKTRKERLTNRHRKKSRQEEIDKQSEFKIEKRQQKYKENKRCTWRDKEKVRIVKREM
jgi:hypothetical protein